MTYNPDDWQVGDLAWITTNEEDHRIRPRPHQHGRSLRMLIRRRGTGTEIGPHTGVRGTWRPGSLHWVSAEGAWLRADSPEPGMILHAERAFVLTAEEAAERNDREVGGIGVVHGTNMTITVPANRLTFPANVAAPTVTLDCGDADCLTCSARRYR